MGEKRADWVIDRGGIYLLGNGSVIQRNSYRLAFAVEGNCAVFALAGLNFVDDGIDTTRNLGVCPCNEQNQGNGVDEGDELHDSICKSGWIITVKGGQRTNLKDSFEE
jgi:hypothetical protein